MATVTANSAPNMLMPAPDLLHVAVSATWALNRVWTFADATGRSAVRQYGFYFVLQTVGASIDSLSMPSVWSWFR
jgi:putative flippase GtrA